MKSKLPYLLGFCFLFFNLSVHAQWVQDTYNFQEIWDIGWAIDACDNNTALIALGKDAAPILLSTTNGGTSWKEISLPTNVSYSGIVDISMIDILHIWYCTDNGKIYATSTGGSSWSLQFYDTTKTPFMNYIKMFDLNNGVAMGDAKGNNPALFLATTNGGSNWISVNDTAFKGEFSGSVWQRLSFVNSNIGYFYSSGSTQQLFKTTDGGRNWLITNYPYQQGELIKFYNENLGLVVNMNYPPISWQMNRTTDGGNSWETFNIDSQEWPNDIEFIPGNPSEVWYVDLGSLYFSSDMGRTWTEQKIYNGKLEGRDLVFTDSTHGWLLCDSGRVFYTSNNGGIISRVSSNKKQIPSEFLLQQNYPNPFNPSTKIKFDIPIQSKVKLVVYDILGRELDELVNKLIDAGSYEVELNGRNLSSGVYLYRIQAGNFIATKKLVLTK